VELAFAPAVEQARLVRNGEVSPVELVETYLERIGRLDPQLNSYVTVCGEEALAEAREDEAAAAHERELLPPFHGVPISIKDLNEVAGVRTTFSSRAFADNVPEFDGATVRRLRSAGFIVLGKTNTPEFGTIPLTHSELNGICRNPWAPDRTPGGSSGGAASALGAGLCGIAHGSDGGGSIRIPASCCGLFGIKPSRGRVSRAPYGDLNGLSTSGPLSRTVADAAAFLDIVQGYEAGDPYPAPPPQRPYADEVGAEPGRLRIAWTAEPPVDVPVDAACRAAVEDAAVLLAELGHEVEEQAPPWRNPELDELFMILWQPIPAISGVIDRSLLTPLNRALAEASLGTSSPQYLVALARLQTYARQVVRFWDDVDLVLTPTLALPPVPVGWLDEEPEPLDGFRKAIRFTPFTPAVNLTGQPAVSLPLGWADDGLPIGVQLIGAPLEEDVLFRVSAQVEAARPWADRRPPVT
jgi:amidase